MVEPEIPSERVSSEEEIRSAPPASAHGPEMERRTVRTESYYSNALGRNQPFTYVLPKEAEATLRYDGETRYPLLVLLHGRDSHHDHWARYTRVARYFARYRMVVVCPEGANGWYTNAADGSERYEDDLINHFLPYVQTQLPIVAPGKQWGIGGVSMGGYGAIKLALKYPHLFSVGISHSGALEKPAHPEVHPVFGDPCSDASFRRRESLFYQVELAMSRWPTERPRLHLDCGLSDPLLEANRRFKDHLTFIGYPHTYRELPGFHSWPYWDRALRTLLPTVAQELGIEASGL